MIPQNCKGFLGKGVDENEMLCRKVHAMPIIAYHRCLVRRSNLAWLSAASAAQVVVYPVKRNG